MHPISKVPCPICGTLHNLKPFAAQLRDNPVFACEPGCGSKFEVVDHQTMIVVAVEPK